MNSSSKTIDNSSRDTENLVFQNNDRGKENVPLGLCGCQLQLVQRDRTWFRSERYYLLTRLGSKDLGAFCVAENYCDPPLIKTGSASLHSSSFYSSSDLDLWFPLIIATHRCTTPRASIALVALGYSSATNPQLLHLPLLHPFPYHRIFVRSR